MFETINWRGYILVVIVAAAMTLTSIIFIAQFKRKNSIRERIISDLERIMTQLGADNIIVDPSVLNRRFSSRDT